MSVAKLLAVTAMVLGTAFAGAKSKKPVLPVDILAARTVLVIVDPSAGVDVRDPYANRLARENVEKALIQWGRFRLVQEGFTADLIMVVRKGNGQLVEPTIGGTPVNGIPPISGSTTSSPGQTSAGGAVRLGRSGIPNDASNAGIGPSDPRPQVEVGAAQDVFAVYRGSEDPKWSPLDSPAVWRYSRKDALESPSVPAVEAFRKLIAESEKQLATHP